jgi:hypothetical protein
VSAILPPPGRARFVPAEGRIDGSQLRALLALLLAQMVRRGTDASSGVKGNPLLLTVYSMTFFGLLTAQGAFRGGDLDTYLARVFASALVLVALMVTAESDDVRMRRAEILLTKPVSGATHLASVAIVLMLTAAVIAGSFALLPMLAAVWRLGLSPLLVPVLMATLFAGAFGLVLGWVLVLRAGVHRLGADRIRMGTQIGIVTVMGLLAWSSLAGAVGPTGGPPLLSRTVLEVLPSTWLARFWSDDWTRDANLRRAGVVALLGLSVTLFVRFGQRTSADAIFETTTRPRATRPPLTARAIAALGRVPGLHLLLPRPVATLSACILTLGRREEASRLRGFVSALLGIGVAAWGCLGSGGLMPVAILTSVLITAALEGLTVARQSASTPAAWALAKSPIAPRHLVRGILWAVFARFVLLPLVLLAALLSRQHGVVLAGLLALGGLLTARIVVLAGLAIRPSFPLDEPPAVTGVLGTFVSWIVGTMGAAGYAIVSTLVTLVGEMAGTAVALVGTLGLAVVPGVQQWGAARRLGLLEYAG